MGWDYATGNCAVPTTLTTLTTLNYSIRDVTFYDDFFHISISP